VNFSRGFAVSITLFAAIGVAFGSETNQGAPPYSSAPDSGYQNIAAFSAAIGVGGVTNAGGSAVLYAAQQVNVAGVNTMFLDFATSAHVTASAGPYTFNLHEGAGLFTLNGANSTVANPVNRGNGNYTLPEDLAWVGDSVTQNQVTPAQWAYLTALTAVNGMIASAFPKVGDTLTNFGFGRSGQYLYDDFNPVAGTHTDQHAATFTPGLQANGDTYTAEGFYWDNTLVGDQYGANNAANGALANTDRFTTTVSNGVFTYTDGIYEYDAMEWDLLPTVGTGQINRGDSGGAIWNGDDIIGINSFAFGSRSNGGAVEKFYYGTLGGGLAFTPQDITWLDNEATVYAAPEPTTLIGLAIFGIGALARRRRRK